MKKYKVPTLAELFLYVTYLVVGFAEVLIGLRVILKLFGADSVAPFVNWIYVTTTPLLQPFSGMFPSPRLDGAFVIEFSALFALIVYALVAYFLQSLIAFTENNK